MIMNNLTLLKIRQLDKKLNIFSNFEVPKVGWINFIRKTLGITFEQISNKLNTSAHLFPMVLLKKILIHELTELPIP